MPQCQCCSSSTSIDFDTILFYPIALAGGWGTTDEFATIPCHLVLFSAALVEMTKSIPVHSLKESSSLLPCILLLFLLQTASSLNLSSHHRGREHLW